jgi:hypothetical protein
MKTKNFPVFLYSATVIVTVIACVVFQPVPADLPTTAPTEQKPAREEEPAQPEPASPEPTNGVPAAVPSNTPVTSFATEFDLAQANQVAPEDVLSEIDYYGSGSLPCPDSPYDTPTPTYIPTMELLMPGYYVMCGWIIDLSLSATVEYPDGRLEPLSIQIEEYEAGEYMAWFSFTPQLDDPEGEYIFRTEGGPFKSMSTVYYFRPDGPRLIPKNGDQIFLYGFAPQEPVRLFCYDVDTYTLLGWQEYQVDGNGQLTLDVAGGRCNFAALGLQSGEVYMLIDVFPIGPMPWISTSIMK